MYNHAPPGYDCPFCQIIKKAEKIQQSTQLSDVIYYSKAATAFLALHCWPKNPVNVLVIPNEHFENLYDLPLEYANPLHQLTRAIALSLKRVYHCDGISTRQHNEPAGSQDVWHYHVHITPRYTEDGFYKTQKVYSLESERLEHARHLREYVYTHQAELFTN